MNSILQFKGWLLPGCINFNAGRAGRPLTIVWLFCEVKSCQAPALSTDVFYANCAAARAAGKAPLLRGQPDYRAGLERDGDGDGDGRACEKGKAAQLGGFDVVKNSVLCTRIQVMQSGQVFSDWYSVSRLIPSSRAITVLRSPAATRCRACSTCSAVSARLRPLYFPACFALAIPSR